MEGDLAGRLDALAELNRVPLPDRADLNPALMSDEMLKDRFLEALSHGISPAEAAKALGKTGTWFRRRAKPKSVHYDEDFAERYDAIMAPDGEYRAAIVDNARADLVKAAREGNVRAIEKILMAYDPDFQFLRPQAATGDVNIDKVLVLMNDLPTPVLEQVKRAYLEGHRALPAADT